MMSDGQNSWLQAFAVQAAATDTFAGKPDHVSLLAAGLIGETGSVVAEFKKVRREGKAYPVYRSRLLEEIGDLLWYFVRIVSVLAPSLLSELPTDSTGSTSHSRRDESLPQFLRLGSSVGAILETLRNEPRASDAVRKPLANVWQSLLAVCREASIRIEEAAEHNIKKTADRWPKTKEYCPLFDDAYPEEEQLPRHLEIDFRERSRGGQKAVILRCNGLNFGDRLTDNIEDPDGYRYHDIFHFSYAVHLGWSPITRALLRSKRKSVPEVDEAQDGARAGIIEEAVAAIVFSRAKQLAFYEGLDHVDFDLLKTIKEFVRGFEVERVPMWQWELAILDGYRAFRLLRGQPGGHVTLDLNARQLMYQATAS